MKIFKIGTLLLFFLSFYVQQESVGMPVSESKLIVDGVEDFSVPVAQPLTEIDQVGIRDGHFYTGLGKAGGRIQRVRFFGVNLALSANFPSPDEGERLARRLASLGVNIVRLHAIDQPAGQDYQRPNGILIDAQRPDLDLHAVLLLNQLIETLNKYGIYVDLNLNVNHSFPSVDRDDYVPPQSKPIYIFDRKMREWQERYIRNLAANLNLKNRPGVALIEISNETTLTDNWQENRLPSLVKGTFYSELFQEWRAYKQMHPEINSAMLLPLARSGLSDDQARIAARFFISLDKRYIDEMANVVRTAAGPRIALSGTQIIHSGRWKHGGLANIDINTASDYIDAHFYIDHYYFPNKQWDWRDWRIDNNWIGNNLVDTISNVAFARFWNKPFVISEFNQPWPNVRESAILPMVTQVAASQDWDGLILYAYAHDRNWENQTPSDFSLAGDWTKLVQFRQCAMYFRNVYPGVTLPVMAVRIGEKEKIDGTIEKISGELLKFLKKNTKISDNSAFTNKIELVDNANLDLINKNSPASSSYLFFNNDKNQITFGSSYAAGFSGYLEPHDTAISSIMTLIRNPGDSEFVTAFLTSQDGLPLARSKHLLLTLPGATYSSKDGRPLMVQKVRPGSQWWTIPSSDDHPSGNLYQTETPIWMERISMLFKIKLMARDVMVYALNQYGRRVRSWPEKVENGEIALYANDHDDVAWPAFEIEVVGDGRSTNTYETRH